MCECVHCMYVCVFLLYWLGEGGYVSVYVCVFLLCWQGEGECVSVYIVCMCVCFYCVG